MILRGVGACFAIAGLMAAGCQPAARSPVRAGTPAAHPQIGDLAVPGHAGAQAAPETGHPRLWLRAADLPRLRSWAVDSNPIYRDGLAPLAAQARADMDAGRVPAGDMGGTSYEEYPSEAYAELFAFMSLISGDQRTRADYARRARTLLMHAIQEAAKGPAAGQPFRDPRFSISDRSRWWGEAFPLTVDWIYPSLSAADKATIRRVFLGWADENVHADTTTDNHPEPIGVHNNPVLLRDRIRVRYAANNYYDAHMRNIGLMAMSLDPADDPGHVLGKYLDDATGAWLYTVDYLFRHDARGGLAPEGFEYSPHSVGYVAQFLLALHTAGQDNPATRGPQVVLSGNPFWTDLVPAYLHSLSPAPVPNTESASSYLGPVYEPAWYGDAQQYWAPDNMELFGPLGLYDYDTGNSRQMSAIRWIQTYTAPGGAARLTDRVRRANYPRDAILYFLLFDPHAPAPADPRPSFPLTFFAPGIGHILARTSWRPDAAWFDHSLGWNSIDHQHADGNSFEFYRRGEWLTKQRTGYGSGTVASIIGSSQAQNTLTLENDPPAHNAPDDYRHGIWQIGSQWPYGLASGDGQILAHSFGNGYVYALGDATALYNSASEGATDITGASRSILWLQPDYIIIYDRASSRTAGRFKRFWLQLPAQATVSGDRATMTTARGQRLYVTTLLPTAARITSAPAEAAPGEPAVGEPMRFTLRVEAPGGLKDVRFLHVLQGADPGTAADRVSLVQSSGGTPFAGALVKDILVLFPVDVGDAFTGLSYTAPAATKEQLITGLAPNGGYDVAQRSLGGMLQVTVRTGTAYRADSGGVLALGARAQQGQASTASAPTATPATATPQAVRTPRARATATRTPRVAPTATRAPAASPVAGPGSGDSGHITYTLANRHVYRIAARAGARPEDLSLALDRLGGRGSDDWVNISANGAWLVLSSGRFDSACASWSCLDLVRGDLSRGEVVRAGGQLVHPGFGAVASSGALIVYSDQGGPHTRDLYAITRGPNGWSAPRLLSGPSPYAYNEQPAISYDGRRVVFECGPRPYGDVGTALCTADAAGGNFRVILTPTDPPHGLPRNGLLQEPGYAPGGSIVFEGDYAAEQIWRLPAGARIPTKVTNRFNNDNSPCVLPDGRIVSLWLDRPGGAGLHELKVMSADGSQYVMALTNTDVADIGIGCGR